jgi:hypothetical protein
MDPQELEICQFYVNATKVHQPGLFDKYWNSVSRFFQHVTLFPFLLARSCERREGRIHLLRRLARYPRLDVQGQDADGPPRETRHDASIDHVPPRVRQALHGGNNRGDANAHAPAHDLPLLCRVHESHRVEGRQQEVVPAGPVLAGDEREAALHHQRAELQLESLVPLHVREPQASQNVGAAGRELRNSRNG